MTEIRKQGLRKIKGGGDNMVDTRAKKKERGGADRQRQRYHLKKEGRREEIWMKKGHIGYFIDSEIRFRIWLTCTNVQYVLI